VSILLCGDQVEVDFTRASRWILFEDSDGIVGTAGDNEVILRPIDAEDATFVIATEGGDIL